VQGKTPPYPAAPGSESRHDAEVQVGRLRGRWCRPVQWHDGHRAVPSLNQTVYAVSRRACHPSGCCSQGAPMTSRLVHSLAAGYRALSSSSPCRPRVYMRDGGGAVSAPLQ
jgi:hypothetical protein